MTNTKIPKIGDLMWHIHHEVLCEPLTEPLENRIDYIKQFKPESEIETRLRLLTPVRGDVPREFDKARAEVGKARAEYDKAQAEYGKALKVHMPALEALHAIEHPDCPWDGGQGTIFQCRACAKLRKRGKTIFPEVIAS